MSYLTKDEIEEEIRLRAHALYETPHQLQVKITEYIKKFENPSDGDKPPTITGMALHLGFCSRQSFYDYEKRGGFSYIIKAARSFMEQKHEENLFNPACTGSIFWLKNAEWSDKQEIDSNVSMIGEPTINLNLSDVSD